MNTKKLLLFYVLPACANALAQKLDQLALTPPMVAVLASPRFLFREEGVKPAKAGQVYP